MESSKDRRSKENFQSVVCAALLVNNLDYSNRREGVLGSTQKSGIYQGLCVARIDAYHFGGENDLNTAHC